MLFKLHHHHHHHRHEYLIICSMIMCRYWPV